MRPAMAVALLWTCAWLQPTPTAIIQLLSDIHFWFSTALSLSLSLSLFSEVYLAPQCTVESTSKQTTY